MDSSAAQQAREPSAYLILVGLVGSPLLIALANAATDLRPEYRYALAQFLFTTLSVFLIIQVCRHSGVRQSQPGEEMPWRRAAAFGLVLLPLGINLAYHVYSVMGHAIPRSAQIAVLLCLLLMFVFASMLAAIPSDPGGRKTIAHYIVVPVSLLSFVLFLGGPEAFGFLLGTIDQEFLRANFILRTILFWSLVLTLIGDALFSFARLRRSVTLALSREREKLRAERQLVIRQSSNIGRFFQFAIYDLSRIWVLGSTIFTTGLYVLAKAVLRSLDAIWRGLSAASLGAAALIFLALIFQNRAEYALGLIGRTPWVLSEGWERLGVWALYLGWIGGSVALFYRLVRVRADDVNFAATTVYFFLLSGAWGAAAIATLLAITVLPALTGYRGITPFLALGIALVLYAVLRWGRRRQSVGKAA